MSDEPLLDVKLLRDGCVVGGVVRRAGETVKVSAGELERLTSQGFARPSPMVRCVVANRLIGSRVCQPGDVVPAPSVAVAKDLHKFGVAEWLNAAECRESLPAKEPVAPRRPGHPMVALCDFIQLSGGRQIRIPGGASFSVDTVPQARDLIHKGFAAPVGWSVDVLPKLRVRAARGGVRVDSRILAVGDVVEVDADNVSPIVSQALSDGSLVSAEGPAEEQAAKEPKRSKQRQEVSP